MTTVSNKILIAGAGPTGLVLALSLARRGVTFRIIDQLSGPGQQSRAMAMHARTLEFYQQFGFADAVVAQGVKAETLHNRQNSGVKAYEAGALRLKEIGKGLSPFPFVLAYPQDDHERFLLGKLQELGVSVEWNTRLEDFTQSTEGVTALVSQNGAAATACDFSYILGCDGARSQVRQSLKLEFPGGTYNQLFYVADVSIASGFERDIIASLGRRSLALMLPVRSSGMQRLIGLVPPELSHKEHPDFEDVKRQAEEQLRIEVRQVNWFSTYRVHHRVAEHFRVGRAFLLGDAGHLHSPAGGQGMNTGIGDAINLGWKLAHVLEGRADVSLLDSYEPERITFARALVATTDRAFTAMVAQSAAGAMIRRLLAPAILSLVTRIGPARRALFRRISQIHIHYGKSRLNQGKVGKLRGGARLPWITYADASNFAPLASLDWQVHVYGSVAESLRKAADELKLPCHQFVWNENAQRAGFVEDALYLVRPDGYIGLIYPTQNAMTLKGYWRNFYKNT